MSESMNTYSRYVEEEDTFYKQLETLEQCQCGIFHFIFLYGKQFDKLMVEDVLLRIN